MENQSNTEDTTYKRDLLKLLQCFPEADEIQCLRPDHQSPASSRGTEYAHGSCSTPQDL